MTNVEQASDSPDLSRRMFLKIGAAVGGGLMLGFHAGALQGQEGRAAELSPGIPARPAGYVLRPNAFISISADGDVSFQIPQAEMGQGVYTSLSQLLADELDVAFERVTPLPAPPDDAIYGRPTTRRMGTGGSQTIRSFYTSFRQVGASARAMLVEAAAQRWQVDPATLRTENGDVIDDAHGVRRLSYGSLAPDAARLPAPQEVSLKADKDLRIIGRSVKRLDTPYKVNGKAQYGIDVRMDGLRIATLAASPVVGGKVAHVDDRGLKAVPGRELVVLDDIVAVVGPNYWAAKTGLDALAITWDGGANSKMDTDQIWLELRENSNRPGAVGKNLGDVQTALAQGDRLDLVYELPFLSHAPMEPQNFTVHVRDGGCEMWGGSQVQTNAVNAAAKVLNVTPDKITFHNYLLGGGFGRRLDTDMVEKSVRIAQKVKGPVKVIWSREEDMTQDMYRPAYRNMMSATLTPDGKITSWMHRVAGGSVVARMSGKPLPGGMDAGTMEGAVENCYDIPNFHFAYVQAEPRALNIGYWRGVSPNNNIFAAESFVDELAVKAGQDPVAFRFNHLSRTPRLRAAVQRAAEESRWGSPLPARSGRGICAQYAFGTYIATVAEVEVNEAGRVRVRRMTSVIDAGRVVNPDTLVAQVEGGLIFGLTAALYGDITLKDGRVQQRNFNDYRIMRISETPEIHVHIIQSSAAPGGIGEPGVSAAPPALLNAIAAATGIRLRRLPIDRDILARQKNSAA